MSDAVQTYTQLSTDRSTSGDVTRLSTSEDGFDSRTVRQPLDDDYDGAPYCSDCGARERRFCKCPPRPRND